MELHTAASQEWKSNWIQKNRNIGMALQNLSCISGIVLYQIVSELIWP